ncbi:MAG: citramalate synthase, partial [Chitinivibrionales bacterium]
MTKKIFIYDTTLRDGNQASGVNLSLNDKIKIALKLDSLGIDYIEGGWPNSSNKTDINFYQEIKKEGLTSKVAAFGSTKRPGTKCEEDRFLQMLLDSEAPVATIYGKSWDLHVSKVIRCSLEENLEMIHDSVAYLKRYFESVVFDAEHYFDGYIKNREYALKTVKAAEEAGADSIVLCDTNGG